MITDIMIQLERYFNAWLVTRNDIREDAETVIRNYCVFTEDDILVVCFNEKLDYDKSFEEIISSVKKVNENDLKYYYDVFLRAYDKLDNERKQRLSVILDRIKPEYDNLCEKLYPLDNIQ